MTAKRFGPTGEVGAIRDGDAGDEVVCTSLLDLCATRRYRSTWPMRDDTGRRGEIQGLHDRLANVQDKRGRLGRGGV